MLFQFVDIVFQLFQTFPAGLILFLAQCLALHLELDKAAVQSIHFLRHGINFHADATACLINQVNGLIRQLPIGNVAMAEPCRRDDGAITDVYTVVDLIAFFEATQDGDGVFHRGLIHLHLLETAFQGRVLFDVLAVFIQRRRTHAVQLAASQCRLEHIAGIHGAFTLAGTDHGMQLINKQDDATFLLGQFVEDSLEPLLEFAPVFGASNQCRHVQGQHLLVLQTFRHFAVDDPLGQAFHDGGLAHPGLANKYRIVLGTALQHLDSTADFVVTADHRVQLA